MPFNFNDFDLASLNAGSGATPTSPPANDIYSSFNTSNVASNNYKSPKILGLNPFGEDNPINWAEDKLFNAVGLKDIDYPYFRGDIVFKNGQWEIPVNNKTTNANGQFLDGGSQDDIDAVSQWAV